VLIPYDCDSFSKQGLNQLLENLVDLKQDHNPALQIEGIVINNYTAQARLPNALIEQLKSEALPVLNTHLHSSVKMKESHYACKPLVYFARSHKLTEQFRALFEEIETNLVPVQPQVIDK
jgi:chromosome partitioning protein